jgi:hypothetical protein
VTATAPFQATAMWRITTRHYKPRCNGPQPHVVPTQ